MADMKELTGSTYFPAEGQSFRNYIEELLKAKPKFSGLFTQESPVKPVSAGTTQPTQAVQPAYPSSNAPFGYDSEGNRFTAPQTNMTDAEWAAVKQLRDEQGWNNPYDTNMLKAAGMGLMGVLGGGNPLSFATSAYRASGPAQTAMDYLYEYMNPNAAASPSFNTAALTNPTIVQGLLGGYAPSEDSIRLAIQMANEVPQQIVAPEPVAPAPVAPEPVAVSYPVPSSAPVYAPATGGYVPTYTGSGLAPSGSAYFGYSTPVYYSSEGE